jgi:hypothetical protein
MGALVNAFGLATACDTLFPQVFKKSVKNVFNNFSHIYSSRFLVVKIRKK